MSEKTSTFSKQNGILIAEQTADANDAFVDSIFQSDLGELDLVVLAMDRGDDGKVLACAEKIAERAQALSLCTIAILGSVSDDEEAENKEAVPIEIRLKELKEKVNTFIIAKEGHSAQKVIDMLLSLYRESPETQGKLLAQKFKNGGFSYYNAQYRPDAWNAYALMDYTVFDSMFLCPIFTAGEVFCVINAGKEFAMTQGDELGDEGLVISFLEDYLSTEAQLNTKVIKNDEMAEYAVDIQLLFGHFGEEVFDFDEKGNWRYPKTNDKRLENRVSRLLQLPFHNNRKRKRHEKLYF